jgi:hypothetical protein
MSACSAFSDDTHHLVDSVLARVRTEARLDDEPVLPPLEAIIRRLEPAPRPVAKRPTTPIVLVPTPAPLPSPEAIVAAAVKESERTQRAKRFETKRRLSRWPVLLCGFVSGVTMGAAFMLSPVGQKPVVQREVQHALKVTRANVASAYQATAAFTADVARR